MSEYKLATVLALQLNTDEVLQFYVNDGGTAPDCSLTGACETSHVLDDVGMDSNMNSGATSSINAEFGSEFVLSIPIFSDAGIHGFSVHMINGISDLHLNYTVKLSSAYSVPTLPILDVIVYEK